MATSDVSVAIPEGYEIVKTIGVTGPIGEYVARHKTDGILVRLRVFDFSQTSGLTTRRHFREHLRSDITFMEELERPGIIRLFDYSDTKNNLWIATQPAEVNKLCESFDLLASQSFESRRALARRFLAILERIHSSRVVHRNLNGETLFLSPQGEIYIGDFGFASYLTDRPTAPIEPALITNTS